MVRELGPLMTCVVLAARSGSAFAAEIGTMKVNEEIDALTTMGIDPVRFLVIPKVLAAVCMTPLLAAFANLAGIVGGALVSSFVLGQPLVVYTNLLKDVIHIQDIGIGLGKAVIFGIIVASIGCIRGMQTRNTPTAVGEAATSAVVTSIVFISITDALLAVIVQVLGI
jgi:phospholipid/cholesterol/gamma-HCH transport system permease protein